MSLIKRLLHKIHPDRDSGTVRITMTDTKNPNYLLFSTDKQLLEEIKTGLNHTAKVWRVANSSEFHFMVSSSDMAKICSDSNLGFTDKDLQKELRAQGAVISGGHKSDHSDQLAIDFSEPVKEITFEQFKEAYQNQYKSELFKNPFSTMKKMLNDQRDLNMGDIERYADEHPTSRTAAVLKSLK